MIFWAADKMGWTKNVKCEHMGNNIFPYYFVNVILINKFLGFGLVLNEKGEKFKVFIFISLIF
jgi:hypothetical protein